MKRGRLLSLDGTGEEQLMDFALWKRRALADGQVDDAEAQELVPVVLRALPVFTAIVQRDGFIRTLLNAEHGLDSPGVKRRWAESQRGNVIPFPGDDTGDPEAA